MIISKSKRRHRPKLFHRKSLLVHFKSQYHSYRSEEKLKKRSNIRRLIRNLHQTYRSLCLATTLIFRLFAVIDRITRQIFAFIEKLIQIIRVIHGWIQMLHAILSLIYLLMSRLMLLVSHIYRIFHLFSIIFQPFSDGRFQNMIRSFSYFVSYYYSSNGACYTLQARTEHFVTKVKERWKRKYPYRNDEEDIYYDAFSEEYEWF